MKTRKLKFVLQCFIMVMLLGILQLGCLRGSVSAESGTNIGTNSLTITNAGNYPVYGTSTGTAAHSITVNTTGTVNLTISNLTIESADLTSGSSPVTITPISIEKGTVNLILVGNNSLTGGYECPGIYVAPGAELVISGEGSLYAKGRRGAAGIGAMAVPGCTTPGKISINSGTIEAIGYYGGAGIGGAHRDNTSEYGAGGTITINGGTVTARSVENLYESAGAGIGGAVSGNGGTITINGGNVTAVGRMGSAGIGSGYNGSTTGEVVSCDTITITGGNISATGGGADAAAIGQGGRYSGSGSSTGIVTVIGGTINLNGGQILPSVAETTAKLQITVYDAIITADQKVTLSIGSKDYSDVKLRKDGMNKGVIDNFYAVKGAGQAIKVNLGSYTYSASANITGDTSIKLGMPLYLTTLWFYDGAITADVKIDTVEVKQNGIALNSTDASKSMDLYCDAQITKYNNGVGKLQLYLPAGGNTDITVKASDLGTNSFTRSSQTINASTTDIVMTDSAGNILDEVLDISKGSITFALDDSILDAITLAVTYSDNEGVSHIVKGVSSKQRFMVTGMTVANTLKIQGNIEVKLELKNLSIASASANPIELSSGAKLYLSMAGANSITVTATTNGCSGIRIPEGCELYISEEGAGGTLTAKTMGYGAGIGGIGGVSGTCGKITISGGVVTATSSGEGAAIGSGSGAPSEVNITISGGTITATAGNGAAIGSGESSTGIANITISGGTITATAGNGAAIGSGYVASTAIITISGGNITAKATGSGAGIGNGQMSTAASNVTISGGTINATSNTGSAIGNAKTNNNGSAVVIITGGSIAASTITDPRADYINPAYKTTVDLFATVGANKTLSDASPTIAGINYGFKDVATDANGKIYLYLRQYGKTATFNNMTYTGTVKTDGSGILALAPAAVTSVTVSPTAVSVDKGKTQQFTASVTGTNNPAQTVKWTVTSVIEGTSISEDGLLTIAAGETVNTLTVTATSTVDTGKHGAATVTVITPKLVLTGTPTASGTYGQSLLHIIPIGEVKDSNNNVVAGTWNFSSVADAATIYPTPLDTTQYVAAFVPTENAGHYLSLEADIVPIMSYLNIGAVATTSGTLGENGWYTSDVTINAPDGYKINTSNTPDSSGWGDSFTEDIEGSLTYGYSLKEEKTGYITNNISINVKIDKIKPTINLSYDSDKTFLDWILGRESLKIIATASDPGSDLMFTQGSGVEKITFTLSPDGGVDTQQTIVAERIVNGFSFIYKAQLTVPTDFKGKIKVDCKDLAGFVADSVYVGKSDGTTGAIVEDNAPVITVNAPEKTVEPSGWMGTATFSVAVEDTTAASGIITGGLKSISYTVDGGAAQTVTITDADTQIVTNHEFDITLNTSGNRTIEITAQDNAGNTATETKTYKIYADTTVTLSQTGTPLYDGEVIAEGADFGLNKGGSNGSVSYQYKVKDKDDNTYIGGLPINAGSYTIKASVAQDDANCFTAQVQTGDVIIGKATGPAVTEPGKLKMVKGIEKSYSFDLSTLQFPADAGTKTYSVTVPSDSSLFSTPPQVNGSTLDFTSASVPAAGGTATAAVTISSENYQDTEVKLTFEIIERFSVEQGDVKAAIDGSNAITYGQPLSTLNLNNGTATFKDSVTGQTVTGILAWTTPTTIPEVATTAAQWIFTPNGEFAATHANVTGSIAIKVNPKNIVITPNSNMTKAYGAVDPVIGYSNTVLEGSDILSGELARTAGENVGEYDITLGSLAATNPDSYTLQLAANAPKFKITVKEINITVDAITAQTYTGSALTPAVVVRDGSVELTAGDYKTQYSNNINAGTATVTVTLQGKYTGEAKKVEFVINKAVPQAVVFPMVAQTLTYGSKLSQSSLSGGSSNGTFAWSEGDIVPTVTNSGYEVTFTPSDAANYDYTGVKLKQIIPVTVNAAFPTVSLQGKIAKTAGNSSIELTAVVTGTGVIPTGSVTFTNVSGSAIHSGIGKLVNGTAVCNGSDIAAGEYTVKATYTPTAGGDYLTADSENYKFDTRKQDQTGFALVAPGTKTYGDGVFTLQTTGGSGTGVVSYKVTGGDAVVVNTSTGAITILKAGNATITAIKSSDKEYNEATAAVNISVDKKMLVFKADTKNSVKGETIPILTYTTDGLVKSDMVTTEPVLVCTATDTNTVGEYPISISGGSVTNNDSYNITYESGKLTVAEKLCNITVVSGENGSISPSGSISVAEGSSQTFKITPNSGYKIAGLVIDGQNVATADSYTFSNVTENHTISATFSSAGSSSSVGGYVPTINTTDSNKITVVAVDANSPATVEISINATVDNNGNTKINVTDKVVSEAIKKAQEEAKKNSAEKNGISLVISTLNSNNAVGITINLPKVVQDALIEANVKEFTIVSKNVEISYDIEAIKNIRNTARTDVDVKAKIIDSSTLPEEAKKAIGSRPVYELSVSYGNNTISSFGKGIVSIAIPYKLQKVDKNGNINAEGTLENKENLCAVYVDNKGTTTYLTNSSYDSNRGMLLFSTNHFSYYGISYKATDVVFNDISDHWAKDDINFVVKQGLFSGTGDKTFSPNASMTRGMFVTVLGRLAEADVGSYKSSSFTDVKNDKYYMGYIEWAVKKGIVSGIGKGQFAPNMPITREQMAVIMVNYSKALGYKIPTINTEVIFKDSTEISSYAATAVKSVQQAGIVSGREGSKFDPKATATRAEASAVIHHYIDCILK